MNEAKTPTPKQLVEEARTIIQRDEVWGEIAYSVKENMGKMATTIEAQAALLVEYRKGLNLHQGCYIYDKMDYRCELCREYDEMVKP